MSLPTFEPLPDGNSGNPAGTRRRRSAAIPPGASDRGKFLHDLSLRMVPTFDYFLFTLLAGVILVVAFLFDSPALYVLAVLLAPFMAPAVGISLGTIAGSLPFVLRSLGSLLAGCLIMFLCGLLAGWAAQLLPERNYWFAYQFSAFHWPDLLVVVIGAGLAAYLVLRAPAQKPLVASVAIAYGLYLPAGVAGFGLSGNAAGLWPNALAVLITHGIWVALAASLVLALAGLRPLNGVGYGLGFLYLLGGIIAVVFSSVSVPQTPDIMFPKPLGTLAPGGDFVLFEPSVTPSLTTSPLPSQTMVPPTLTITPTRTLLPTQTATQTITPHPTPVWARINASEGGGAFIREEPNYNAPVVQSILNETLVEVLPEVVEDGGVAWVQIRMADGKTGWIVRALLRTATPAPEW